MKRKLFASILCIILLTGCWNRIELDELAIIQAFGLDKDEETGQIIITVQVIRPAALEKNGGTEKSPIENATAKGDTVFEAVRNMSMSFDRRSFFAHSKVIILGEELARDGITNIIDLFARSHEIRPLAWIIVAKGTKAENILGAENGLEEIQGVYLQHIIEMRTLTSSVSASNVLDFIKRFARKGTQPIAGAMEIIEQPVYPAEKKEKEGMSTKGVKLSGTAVFKDDKLVGYLNNTETRGLNWVTGKIESGVMNVLSPTNEDKLIAIVIMKSKSKIIPEVRDGKFMFNIEVKVEGVVGEQDTTNFEDPEMYEKVQTSQEEIVKSEIEKAISKVQNEFKADIFGFSGELNRKYPKEWKKVQEDWNNIFSEVQYSVKVDAKIRRTGLETKPITINK